MYDLYGKKKKNTNILIRVIKEHKLNRDIYHVYRLENLVL